MDRKDKPSSDGKGSTKAPQFVDLALKKVHDHIAEEAPPPEFLAILADIDRKLAGKSES